jgi:hypothetical protein
MTRIALMLAALTGALALTPLALAATKPQTVTVTITNLKVMLTTKVHAGKVSFHLVNKGKIARAFRIDGKTSALIAAGKTGTLVVTLEKGSYPYTGTAKGQKTFKGKLQVSA